MKAYWCNQGHEWQADPAPDESGFDRSSVCPTCGTTIGNLTPPPVPPVPRSPAAPLSPRKVDAPAFDARYEVLKELGRGGMGVVYKAMDHKLRREVAIKQMSRGAQADAAELERFHREAEAVASLRHPNFVPIFELSEHEGCPVSVMEYVGGGTLRDHAAWLSRDPRQVAGLFETLARAIQFAHRHGIVHRDLKPANVLLSEHGEPKITDFGLVKRLDLPDDLTQAGTFMGTPSYMAPEQMGGTQTIDGRADVYSLGVMLFEALTGDRPFVADSTIELINRVKGEEPVRLTRLRPGLPRDLETICLKCLRKQPEERYATAQELADDLKRFLSDEPVKARPVGRATRAVKWARRHPAKALTLAFAILALGIGLRMLWHGYAYTWTHVEHHGEIAFRHGTPVGIEPLSDAQASARHKVYDITRRGRYGRPTAMRILNGMGHDNAESNYTTWWEGIVDPQDVLDSPTSFAYRYDEHDRLINTKARDTTGTVIFELQYHYGDAVSEGTEHVVTARYFRDRGFDMTVMPGDIVIELTRDARGYDRRVRFLGRTGTPIRNAEGVFGYRIAYHDNGRYDLVESLDAHGQRMINRSGMAGFTERRDGLGRMITTYIGVDLQPSPSRHNFASTLVEHDENGNPKLITHLDMSGRPTINTQLGCAIIEMKHDARGLLKSFAHFDAEHKPMAVGRGFTRHAFEHDEQGRIIGRKTWGEGDRLVQYVVDAYDDKGQLASSTTYADEEASKPLHVGRYAYENGRQVLERYYKFTDGSDEPELRIQIRKTWDENGRAASKRFVDGGDPPQPFRLGGYSSITYTYHATGELDRRIYGGYDPAGGYDTEIQQFTTAGMLKRFTFQLDGGYGRGPKGFSDLLITRDPGGRPTQLEFQIEGKSVPTHVEVEAVTPGSPAAEAGLLPGDRLIRYDGNPVTNSLQFDWDRTYEARHEGKPLTIRRGEEEMTVPLNAGAWGLKLEDILEP